MLTPAQLISDCLSEVQDPVVQRLAPRLIRTIDRAIQYTRSVVSYGQMQDGPPQRHPLLLWPLVEDVRESFIFSKKCNIAICNHVPNNFVIDADGEQLHRIITNLCRNAVQAMTASDGDCAIKQITITAEHNDTTAVIRVEDTGPGLSPKAKKHLFIPFQGSGHKDGIGLGLAICFDLVHAHGGTIKLLEGSKSGAHFEIRIPNRSASTFLREG